MEGIARASAGFTGARSRPPHFVMTGILEPRKNQGVVIDACEALRKEGLEMDLHVVGRVNPHFGGPLANRIAELMDRWPGLQFHSKLDDAKLATLVRSARATAFPSLAEGCGLPVLECFMAWDPVRLQRHSPSPGECRGRGMRGRPREHPGRLDDRASAVAHRRGLSRAASKGGPFEGTAHLGGGRGGVTKRAHLDKVPRRIRSTPPQRYEDQHANRLLRCRYSHELDCTVLATC